MLSNLHFLAIIFSLVGLSAAIYIFIKKRIAQPLVCPLQSNCNAVVRSKFATLAGIPLENLGIAYYVFTLLVHIIFVLNPDQSIFFSFLSLVFALGALIFSVYLVAIQAFVLKEWCVWCLISAFSSAVICYAAFHALPQSVEYILSLYRPYIVVIHAAMVAIGLGAAVVTDVFFFQFLKDLRISEEESKILNTISKIIWMVLVLIFASGFALFYPESERLLGSAKFLAKLVVFSVLVINGFILNWKIAPKLVHISFGEKHDHMPGELKHLKHLALFLGGVSISSWVYVFILGSMKSVIFSLEVYLGIYILILIGAFLGSRALEWKLRNTKE